MKFIGITGGIACGKSTFSSYLREKGFVVIDADQIVHELLRSDLDCIEEISNKFNLSIEDGKLALDRQVLGKIVFSDKQKLKELEEILHPRVHRKVLELKEIYKDESLLFYDIPLLFEKDRQGDFDFTVCVSCSEEIQKQRMKNRNNWSDSEIESRLHSQMSLIEKQNLADYTIFNNSTVNSFKLEIEKYLANLLRP